MLIPRGVDPPRLAAEWPSDRSANRHNVGAGRLDFDPLAPGFAKAMGHLDTASGEGPLDRPRCELVRTHEPEPARCWALS